MLKPAELFIFDDAASALDLKTEAALYRALKESHPDSTKIIIAQRIASVRTADRIVVLENGGILAPSLQSGAVDIIAGEKQGILSHTLTLMLSPFILDGDKVAAADPGPLRQCFLCQTAVHPCVFNCHSKKFM